jgi:hypothetical protein
MEIILLIFFATLSFSFSIAYWATLNRFKRSNVLMAELAIKNAALEALTSKIKNNEGVSDDLIHKENFIKFLSDSRDWAFEYIEQSQKTIKEVSEELKDKGLDNYSDKLLSLLPPTTGEK